MSFVSPKITVVIPVFNQWFLTTKCLLSIFRSVPRELIKIIIVDNASTDMTSPGVEGLISLGYPIDVIYNDENLGYLLAANQGWAEAKTDYILHMNNDVTVESGCIMRMLEVMEKYPQVGVCGGIEGHPEVLGKTMFRRGADLWKYQDYRYLIPMTEKERLSDCVECETTGFACALIRKSVSDKIGFYDTKFVPCMGEQEDFCLRVLENGWEVVVSPKAFYNHKVGQSTKENAEYFRQVIEDNIKKFKEKWRYVLV